MSVEVSVREGVLHVGDDESPLISGEVQFWRMERSTWSKALDRVVELGIPIVSTYLSWRRHEPEEGNFEWGMTTPELNLRAFLELCKERKLWVQLKPGPWICAEELGGGYPDWIMANTEDLALGAGDLPIGGYDNPFVHPVPSMQSPRYRGAARRWLDEVAREMGDLAFPRGPVIAIQLDNEPSLAFQDALYFSDYHPNTIAIFRQWLEAHYGGDVNSWKQAWGNAAAQNFEDAQPPRPDVLNGDDQSILGRVQHPTPFNLTAIHDWTRFLEDTLVEHLIWLRTVHINNGLGHLLFTVNLIPNAIHEIPLSHQRVREGLGRTTAVGVDHYYDPPMGWDLVDWLAWTAASARAAGEPIVWAPELMAGIWRSPGVVVNYPDPLPSEQAAWWGAAIALGYQGFNLYMLADRENWEFAPISVQATLTEFSEPIRRIMANISKAPNLLRASPINRIVIAWYRPDAFDAYTTVGTMRQPKVPWAKPELRAAYDARVALTGALLRRGYGYEVWNPDTDPLPPSGTTILVSEPTNLPEIVLDRAREADCKIIRITPSDDLDEALPFKAPAWLTTLDNSLNAITAIHRGTDNSFFLHIAQWGDGDISTPRELNVDDEIVGTNGQWVDLETGQALAQIGESRWQVDAAIGHQIFRWVC